MQNSFNELVKIILEEYNDERGDPISGWGKVGRDIGRGLISNTLKAGGLGLKTAMFGAGITPFNTGLSKLPDKVFRYKDSVDTQQKLFRKHISTVNARASIKSVSEAINIYYRTIVNDLQLLQRWGIENLEDYSKGEVIAAQRKFWFTDVIPQAQKLNMKIAKSAFDIETYSIKTFLEQIDVYNKTAPANSSIKAITLSYLMQGLINEKRLPSENINLIDFLHLIQSLFLTVKGGKVSNFTVEAEKKP